MIRVQSLDVEVPDGWSVTADAPDMIEPGREVTVPVTLEVPATATGGSYAIPIRLTDSKGRSSQGTLTVVVPKTPDEKDGRIRVTGGTLSNPQDGDYVVGDRLQFSYRITNLTGATTTVVPTGNLRDLDPAVDARNCRWRNLPGGGAYNCNFPYHIVTQEDLDRGSFTPKTVWTSTSGEDVTVVEHEGPAVPLP